MDSFRQKLRRADRHLQALKRAAQLFHNSKPYAPFFSVVKEPDGTYGVITIKVLKPVPDSLGLIVGDICNNLRSALDHLLWQLRINVEPDFDGIVYFPIIPDEPTELFHVKAARDIKGLSLAQRTKIEASQPYKRGNNFLSILRELNRVDKHRLIPVVAAEGRITIFELSIKGDLVVPQGRTLEIPVQTAEPIEDGAELWRIPLSEGMTKADVRLRFGFSYEFIFGDIPAIASNQYVGRTMQAIRDEVRWVLSQF